MKSHNFHTELSILSFLLLWTVSQFALFCHCFIGPQDPNDVQIKIITAAEKRCSEDTSRMAETGNYLIISNLFSELLGNKVCFCNISFYNYLQVII